MTTCDSFEQYVEKDIELYLASGERGFDAECLSVYRE